MVKAGVAVILLAQALLLGAFLLPDVLMPLASLYCHAGEKLTQKTFTFSIPGESSTTFYYHCVSPEGVEKADVSGQVTGSILTIFAVIEISGVGLTMLGSRRKRQRTFSDDPRQAKVWRPPKASKTLTLAERLHQLQEAHNEGLIDDEEYGRLRREALDRRD
ncbi:MAG: hypothetical protein ABI700_06440 [Chloroflexota bacterium]